MTLLRRTPMPRATMKRNYMTCPNCGRSVRVYELIDYQRTDCDKCNPLPTSGPLISATPLEPRRAIGRETPVRPCEPMPKKRQRYGKGKLPHPTLAQSSRFVALYDIGCIACVREGREPSGRMEVHHLLDPATGRRISHDATIGLCATGCHQNGTAERPARHPMQGGRVMFETYHGCTEQEMLEDTDRRVALMR